MELVWSVKSAAFSPELDEGELVNPGLGGRKLAFFLKSALEERGVAVNQPRAEDWGWRLELRFEGRRFWAGCGAVAGESESFLVFLKPRRGLRGLLAGAVWRESFARLAAIIEGLLREHPQVRDLSEERA